MLVGTHVQTGVKVSSGGRGGVRGGDERMRGGHYSAVSTTG